MPEQYAPVCCRVNCGKPATVRPIIDLYRGHAYSCGAFAAAIELCAEHGANFSFDSFFSEGDWLELVEAFVSLGKEPPDREKCLISMGPLTQMVGI